MNLPVIWSTQAFVDLEALAPEGAGDPVEFRTLRAELEAALAQAGEGTDAVLRGYAPGMRGTVALRGWTVTYSVTTHVILVEGLR
ncbi:hypothetical protein [Paraburkholderia kururiensis]|uniref:hypothetical protein n=1 Tax=Paraburkholderia kururiensis TaxID=984307 RepID=UPI000F8944B2|nr:hypothetical protein [Paraburkholderia kururiensis]